MGCLLSAGGAKKPAENQLQRMADVPPASKRTAADSQEEAWPEGEDHGDFRSVISEDPKIADVEDSGGRGLKREDQQWLDVVFTLQAADLFRS